MPDKLYQCPKWKECMAAGLDNCYGHHLPHEHNYLCANAYGGCPACQLIQPTNPERPLTLRADKLEYKFSESTPASKPEIILKCICNPSGFEPNEDCPSHGIGLPEPVQKLNLPPRFDKVYKDAVARMDSVPAQVKNPRLLDEHEMLCASLIGKYHFVAVRNVIVEACLHQDAKSFEAGKASVKMPTVEEIAGEIACGIDRVAAQSWKYMEIATAIQALMGQESK